MQNIQVAKIGAGLVALGQTKGSHVGIFSINRPEWTKTLFGIWSQGMVCVPLYDTLGATAAEYILNHSENPVVFVSKAKISVLFEEAKNVPSLK